MRSSLPLAVIEKIKLRGHHLEYLVHMTRTKKDNLQMLEAASEHMANIFGQKYARSLIDLESQLTPDTLVEIVEGRDYICENLGCPYEKECAQGNYQALAVKMAEFVPIFLLSYPILLFRIPHNKEELEKEEVERLKKHGLKLGVVERFREIIKKYE